MLNDEMLKIVLKAEMKQRWLLQLLASIIVLEVLGSLVRRGEKKNNTV